MPLLIQASFKLQCYDESGARLRLGKPDFRLLCEAIRCYTHRVWWHPGSSKAPSRSAIGPVPKHCDVLVLGSWCLRVGFASRIVVDMPNMKSEALKAEAKTESGTATWRGSSSHFRIRHLLPGRHGRARKAASRNSSCLHVHAQRTISDGIINAGLIIFSNLFRRLTIK